MNKLTTLSEALQKWSEGKTVQVSLDISSLKLEDLRKFNEMGAVFSYEAPEENNDIPERILSFQEMLGPVNTLQFPQEEEPVEESLPILFEEEGKTSQAKKQAKKQAGLDTGKIKALRNAGWSLQKIADEMGCCTQTVANVLSKENTTAPSEEENEQSGGKK